MRRRTLYAIAILAAAHAYIWWRLALPLSSPWWQVATVIVVVFAPSFPFTVTVVRGWPRETARPWLLVGYIWFGFAAYLLLGAVAAHLAVAFGVGAYHAALAGGGVAIGVVLLGLANVARGAVVRDVRVELPRLGAAQYRIVQLTDVHIGAVIGREFTEQVVRRVNALEPDAIVITGDLIDGRLSELQRHAEPLRELRARDGVFAVTGNHEYYWNASAWLDHLRSLGIRILHNEHVTLGGALQLAGTDDVSRTEDVERAVAGRDPALPMVLLAHHPRTITRAAAAGVDLQLSGHTHGGQLLPWGWLARIWDPKVSGLARFGRTQLYVSDGTGYWGPPLRIGTICEITHLTLVPGDLRYEGGA